MVCALNRDDQNNQGQRKREGKETKTDMSEKELEKFASKPKKKS